MLSGTPEKLKACMLPQRPAQKMVTNNGRGYCETAGTVQVSTQESSKGMVTYAGAQRSSLFLTLPEMADAAVFEAADAAFFDEAGGIRT